MAADSRPMPVIDADSGPFWEGARCRELRTQRCGSCGRAQFYPRAICRFCSSTQLSWFVSSGRGVVYAVTVSRRPATPMLADRVPYVVAIVNLDEGFRMLTNIVGSDALHTQIDDHVRVDFEDIGNNIYLPVFRRVRNDGLEAIS